MDSRPEKPGILTPAGPRTEPISAMASLRQFSIPDTGYRL
jgi:hypothetical protein